MNDANPLLRRDLEFLPLQHNGQPFVLVRDHLGLVQEGRAVALPLFRVMSLMDGTRTRRDLQGVLVRQSGGVLVGMDELNALLRNLDDSFLLDSERFRTAKDGIVSGFASLPVRPASHSGRAYPADPLELKNRLDEILGGSAAGDKPDGKVRGLIAPHIDISVGLKSYGEAYRQIRDAAPSRVVVLGIGHHMARDLFCLTDKGFETPLGVVKNAPEAVRQLRESGKGVTAADDFVHRSEHSIEFQVVFLRHVLQKAAFSIVPILCGSLQASLPDYSRSAYLEKAGAFLEKLREILSDPREETLLVAGVDFSHIGPKFGHKLPAASLKREAEAHDGRLLQHLSRLDAEGFWEESRGVADRFNVCGFSALACLLEVLPPCSGKVLDYRLWQEEATRSGVSFSAAVFTS